MSAGLFCREIIVKGLARIPSGSLKARPMRTSPTSSPKVREISTSRLDQALYQAEGFIQLTFILAAGLGEVRFSPAPAAGNF
jgi:hypothetical protein